MSYDCALTVDRIDARRHNRDYNRAHTRDISQHNLTFNLNVEKKKKKQNDDDKRLL